MSRFQVMLSGSMPGSAAATTNAGRHPAPIRPAARLLPTRSRRGRRGTCALLPRRAYGTACTGWYTRFSARSVVTATTPFSGFPYRPNHCRPTCAALRSPLSSIARTPHRAATSPGPRSATPTLDHSPLRGQRASNKKNCSHRTAGCFASASAVSVLFRSRGASSPTRYSWNSRRCANWPNRTAYSSNGPGSPGQGRRRVITRPATRHAV